VLPRALKSANWRGHQPTQSARLDEHPIHGAREKEFQLPARLENDANAAGLAEVLFGAAVGYNDVFYVTVSTGVGTGIIINKKIYHGKNGAAAEGGHVTIDHHSPYICGCGTPGCIEALAAGPALVRRARVKLEQEHTLPSLLRERTQNHLSRITPEMIEETAKAGDKVARFIIDETGFFLGIWLASMITLLDPDAIVIGGGVSQIGKPLLIRFAPPSRITRSIARQKYAAPARQLQKERRYLRRRQPLYAGRRKRRKGIGPSTQDCG